MPTPLYTAENVTPAFQLRWSLALFANVALPALVEWWAPLQNAIEVDGARLLEVSNKPSNVWLFLLSTQPQVAPVAIVKSVKGRLQHLLRPCAPHAFRRNFSLASLGDASREVIESYVATQLNHHRMADERSQEKLARFQLVFPQVDLSEPCFSSHGRYVCNLHLVFVNSERACDVRAAALETTRDMFLRAAVQKEYRLSRLSVLADHLHATLGFDYSTSPLDIALGYMNNLAYAHGMKPVLQDSYYVGTFGEYDMQAVRRHLS